MCSSRALRNTVSGCAPVSNRIRWLTTTNAAKPHSPKPSSANMVERMRTSTELAWFAAEQTVATPSKVARTADRQDID